MRRRYIDVVHVETAICRTVETDSDYEQCYGQTLLRGIHEAQADQSESRSYFAFRKKRENRLVVIFAFCFVIWLPIVFMVFRVVPTETPFIIILSAIALNMNPRTQRVKYGAADKSPF